MAVLIKRKESKEEKLVRHLQKCYKGKEFISNDVVNSYRLSLIGGKTPANVKAGMMLKTLCKKGVIKTVAERDNHKVGVNNKVYKLL